MSNIIGLHFKYQDQIYGTWVKSLVEEVTISMIEARIYKRLELDENKVKLQLSYIPLVVGCKEDVIISDDDDMIVFLTSMDENNRKCLLKVEVINILKLSDQLSRVDKNSLGMNDDELHPNDGETRIGADGIALYVDNVQHEAIDDDDGVECEDNDMGRSDIHDEYGELLPSVEYNQCIAEWEDGLGLSVQQEFLNKKALQDVVDRGAIVNNFVFRVVKSDMVRLVLKCDKDICKWGLRAAKIPKTNIFSIRKYTRVHTCSRSDQSTSNIKRKYTPQLIASFLHDDYPGQIKTLKPKTIMDFVQTKYGVKISYSTALRGKNHALKSDELEEKDRQANREDSNVVRN